MGPLVGAGVLLKGHQTPDLLLLNSNLCRGRLGCPGVGVTSLLMVLRKGSVLSTVHQLLTPVSRLPGQSPAMGTVGKALRTL